MKNGHAVIKRGVSSGHFPFFISTGMSEKMPVLIKKSDGTFPMKKKEKMSR